MFSVLFVQYPFIQDFDNQCNKFVPSLTFTFTDGTAELLSGPMYPIAHESCLVFYYNMFGADVETLNVYVIHDTQRTLVFTQSRSQANVWRRGQASIKVKGVHQVKNRFKFC